MLLPASTIQCIIEEFQDLHSSGVHNVLGKLFDKLSAFDIPEASINNIIQELSQNDFLTQYNKGQPTVQEQYKQSKLHQSKDMLLEDVSDGQNVKDNLLLQQYPSSLSLMLYQDAFEVVNPLGPGKTKHKILAVYMTLGEILPHNRSSVDAMQLVLLCREADFKTFGHNKVFASLIADLKDLEEKGFLAADGNMIKAVLIAFLGDNLGSHCIGGFTENFSCSKHFCRYCLVDREGFIKNPLALGPKRTADNYKDSIDILSTTDQSVVNGIKFNSVFNSLKYFHVCSGLPPCLGHDLFEGVVSGDLSLYIDTLVRVEKHFTYNELNRAIAKFKHIGSDALSKPCEVKTGQRLAGSAAQNRCLLRLLPLYIGEKIKDPVDNEVWQLCLKLRDIVELVCAPQISHNDIAYLKIMIEEYIYLRHRQMFPPTIQIIGEANDYRHHLYNSATQDAVTKADVSNHNMLDVSSVVYKVMEIEDEITCILPELERQKVLSFADHLKDVIGVQQKKHSEAEDLNDTITLDLYPAVSEETSTETIHPPSSTSTSCYHSSSWVSDFQIPWQRFPLRLSQAITSGVRAHPEDRRSMVRIVVEAMQVHCKIPKRSACEEIAKIIVNTHPQTFADFTDKGERLGSGHYSLLRSIKCRVEHVNRDNVTHRLRRPKRTRNEEDCSPERDDTSKVVRRLVDSYGCINWHPVQLPEGETQTSLEEKKNRLLAIFSSQGPEAVERPEVEDLMLLTYISQRQLINSCPSVSIAEIQEQWPFLFTRKCLSSHFERLTGIEICERLSQALITKGRRILNYFSSQKLKWNLGIRNFIQEIEDGVLTNNKVGTAAILLMMKYYNENEDSLFLLADEISTRMSLEAEGNLPVTPRLIMLGELLSFCSLITFCSQFKRAFSGKGGQNGNLAAAKSIYIASPLFTSPHFDLKPLPQTVSGKRDGHLLENFELVGRCQLVSVYWLPWHVA
nr:uncharacterized protein LOC129163948 [Nothobranchius furzeri]